MTKHLENPKTATCDNNMLVAVKVTKGLKYELTYIPVDWACPNCKTENNTTLIEEEDLNHSQDNTDKCRKCSETVVIKASDIYCH